MTNLKLVKPPLWGEKKTLKIYINYTKDKNDVMNDRWGYTLPGGPDTTKLQSVTVTVPPPTVNCTGYSSAQFNANYMLCVGAGGF